MRLLVSVTDAKEAAAALAGGADIIDAKDPGAGALGPVALHVFREIHARVAGARPVSAALGDGRDEAGVEDAAHAFAAAGASFVKIGFAGIADADRVERLAAAAVRGAGAAPDSRCDVVAVAYADAEPGASVAPDDLVERISRGGGHGILIDTCNKTGPGLRALIAPDRLALLVRRAREAGLLVALAGRLDPDDLPHIQAVAPDIAGIRGAACDGGRLGRVSADRVRRCRAVCATFSPSEMEEAT